MSYPSPTVWGSGFVKFWLFPADGDAETLSITHHVDCELAWDLIRLDGGRLSVTKMTGEIVYRGDAVRARVTLKFAGITAAQYAVLLKVVNCQLRGGKIVCQPHNDVATRLSVVILDPVTFASTGGVHVGHDSAMVFVGTRTLQTIPELIGTGGVLDPYLPQIQPF